MKRNVDLTENRMFSSFNDSPFEGFLYQQSQENEIFKNDFWKVFMTGNKNDRKRFKELKNMEDQCICDRCGRSLTKVPWDKYYGLCSKCAAELDEEFQKDWRYKEIDKFKGNDLSRFLSMDGEVEYRPWILEKSEPLIIGINI